MPLTILGHLRAFEVGDKYSYNWLVSTMNLHSGSWSPVWPPLGLRLWGGLGLRV